jgi:predicted permease
MLTAAQDARHEKITNVSLWIALVAAIALIIACANVANLLLARTIARRRELALRLSLGARRGRLIRQSMTESLVYAVLGGVAGALFAHWSSGLLKYFELPPWAGRTDLRLLAFALGLSVVTGLLFGVLPALRGVRVDPLRGMQDTRVLPSVSRSHTRRALVVVQVALSLTLLTGASLFVRSLREVLAIDAGVDIDRLITVDVDLAKMGFIPAERELFWEQARELLARLPGVHSAATAQFPPFIGSAYAGPLKVPGVELPKFESGSPLWNNVGPGYFRTTGTRLLDGREFHASDARGEPVAIVSRVLADAIAPGGSVIGRCIQVGDQTRDGCCTRIIGVADNHRRRYLEATPTAMLYLFRHDRFDTWGGPTLIVRTHGKSDNHVAAVRAAIAAMRSDLPFVNARPLTELIRRDLRPFQLAAAVSGMFSVLALALAAVGLYGVLGYFVTERRPEIGIRRSLGAPAFSVARLVGQQAMIPVAMGLIIGFAAAFAGTRFLRSQLFGIAERDPVSFGVAAIFLTLVACAATLLPARRAVRVDPMVALRQDWT